MTLLTLVADQGTAQSKVAEVLEHAIHEPASIFNADALAVLRDLMAKNPEEWERVRLQLKDIAGLPISRLEKLLQKASGGNNRDELFEDIIPWHEVVSGEALLDEISETLQRFVVADKETFHAAALWVAFTWFIDEVSVAPIANITAPEMQCGKTVLLSAMTKLVKRPLATSNIGAAALFRCISKFSPTLLIDEVDSFLKDNEAARGILNAGFTRETAYVIRCVGDTHEPQPFNVWGAKVLCGIGSIAATLADRSIPLRLRRKLVHETVERIRHVPDEHFATLTAKLSRFAHDNGAAVKAARPAEILGLKDRANDCWEPLQAIAEVAGGAWPSRARSAALHLHSNGEVEACDGNLLLGSIRRIFSATQSDRISTAELISTLTDMDDYPWSTYCRGGPITPHQLAKLLSGYKIKPRPLRLGSEVFKGYERQAFKDVFSRYLPPEGEWTVTPLQPSNGELDCASPFVTDQVCVTEPDPSKFKLAAGCNGVSDEAGDTKKSWRVK